MANKIIIKCEACGIDFLIWPCEIENGRFGVRRKYCSLKCRPHLRWPKQTIEERFWNKVDKKNGTIPKHSPDLGKCWIFVGSKNQSGYGQFSYKGRPRLAHRLCWHLSTGRPLETFILHHCDNPCCVRPSHLWEGNAKDNTHDCISKGRFPFRPKGITRTTKLR